MTCRLPIARPFMLPINLQTGFAKAQLSLMKRRHVSDESVGKKFMKISEENVREMDIVLPHHKVPNVVNQKKLIEILKQDQSGRFVYLIYAVPRSSEHYTPYALM